MLDNNSINEISKRIAGKFKPEKIILFGSYAHGNQREDSDLDLLIIQNSEIPIQQRGFEIRMFLREIKIPFDIIIYTPKEFDYERNTASSFIQSVLKNGKILYERVN